MKEVHLNESFLVYLYLLLLSLLIVVEMLVAACGRARTGSQVA